MKFISECTEIAIDKAAHALREGSLVAFPTETVYGLGGDASNAEVVSTIYKVKGRPINHPLIVHISSVDLIYEWALGIPTFALDLAKNFWPGPMTLVLNRSELAKDYITGSQSTVALRIPAQPIALSLLTKFEMLGGTGVVAPSANRFGSLSPTSAFDVKEELGNELGLNDFILDGGESEIGLESTIINCTEAEPQILRPGALSPKMIFESTGLQVISGGETNGIRFPGSLKSHYSPSAEVQLGRSAGTGDGFIAMANVATPIGAIRLAAPKTIDQFAKILYSSLRLGDQKGLKKIIVLPPQGNGLAVAIRDRLLKASG
jgi:L-threonylcarbamoyladenylate synthase